MAALHLSLLLVFWSCVLLVAHTYLFYPALLLVSYCGVQLRRDLSYLAGRRNRRVGRLPAAELPAVSMVVAAYNEGECIAEKLQNCSQLAYPADKLEIIIVSDGSTDATNDWLSACQDPRIRPILLTERKGKWNALNTGVAAARHEVLLFSDASTLLRRDAVEKLARHFNHPGAGVVCGALHFRGTAESQQTEGIYWQWESMLRLMESRLGATLTASGALYALRKSCFPMLSASTLIEDFVVPMHARAQGYEVRYDPEATALETAASSVAGEFTRRVRLAIGSYRALGQLNRVRMPLFTRFSFYSHKVLRWVFPFLLIGILLSSAALAMSSPFFRLVLLLQVLFYGWAALGYALREKLRGIRYALVGYFLVAMNMAFLIGFVRCLRGRGEATWQRVS